MRSATAYLPAFRRQTSEQEAMMRHGCLRRISVLAALAATVALSPELSAGQAPTPGARKAAAVGRDTARPTPQPNQWHVAYVGRAVSQGRCHTRDTNALLCQKNKFSALVSRRTRRMF